MSPVKKPPKSPRAGEYADDFIEESVTLRGRTYTFRELDVSVYDDLVEQSTTKNDLNEEMTDNTLLSKLVTVKSCISPRLPDGLQGMPLRLSQKLRQVAGRVNFGDEPEEKEDEADVQEGEPEEEGEDSPLPTSVTA